MTNIFGIPSHTIVNFSCTKTLSMTIFSEREIQGRWRGVEPTLEFFPVQGFSLRTQVRPMPLIRISKGRYLVDLKEFSYPLFRQLPLLARNRNTS